MPPPICAPDQTNCGRLRIAQRNTAAMALRMPAIARACHSIHLISTPLVLHNTAVKTRNTTAFFRIQSESTIKVIEKKHHLWACDARADLAWRRQGQEQFVNLYDLHPGHTPCAARQNSAVKCVTYQPVPGGKQY